MDNFNLKEYLAENRLVKEDINPKEGDKFKVKSTFYLLTSGEYNYDLKGDTVEFIRDADGDDGFFRREGRKRLIRIPKTMYSELFENKLVKENKMKKSELKKIIKEEIKSVLKEDDFEEDEFEEDEFVDLDAIEKTLRKAYHSHNFIGKDPSKFEDYLEEYLDSVSSYGDKEAYDNLSPSGLLKDFVVYVSELGKFEVVFSPENGTYQIWKDNELVTDYYDEDQANREAERLNALNVGK